MVDTCRKEEDFVTWSLTEIVPMEWPSSTPAKPTSICLWTTSLMTRLKLFEPFFT